MSVDTPRTSDERMTWTRLLYALLQWPFILIGFLLWFIYEGLDIGRYWAQHIQKKMEDRS